MATTTLSVVLRDAWRTLGVWYCAVWAYIKAHIHFHVNRKTVPEWRITTAMAFCVGGFDGVRDGECRDISDWFIPNDDWEKDVNDFLGWPGVRVEFRYVHTSAFGKTTKYRMILRNGDRCVFPPPPMVPGTSPRGVLAARLVPRADAADASPVDVTARVIKYAGPARDFYRAQGLAVCPLDCFPFDDPDALVERFAALTIIDAATFQEREFPLDENQPMCLC